MGRALLQRYENVACLHECARPNVGSEVVDHFSDILFTSLNIDLCLHRFQHEKHVLRRSDDVSGFASHFPNRRGEG